MGTKVQFESYVPGYNLMRNLNENSNSNWSLYYENKTFNGHLYDGFMPRPANGCFGYDKEMFKRTMLEHEAIFRKQVCELHRLYRTQKDLMDELRMKELCNVHVQMNTNRSNLFSSQMPFTEDLKPPLTFMKENGSHTSVIQRKNEVLDNTLFPSKLTRFPRRMLDLELPADVYIDCEDTERTDAENVSRLPFRATDPLNAICDVEHENDVKLTLGAREEPCRSEDGWKLKSHRQNGQSIHNLADLGEPMKSLNYEDHYLQMRSHRSFLPGDFFTDKHTDEGTPTNFVNVDNGEAGWEWPNFYNKAGKSTNNVNSLNPSFSSGKFPLLSEPTHPKLKRAHESPSIEYGKTQKFFVENPSHVMEGCQSSQYGGSNHSMLTSLQGPAPLSVVPHSNYSNSTPSLVSSRQKRAKIISHIPIAVQALPCFNGSELNSRGRRRSNGSIQNLSIDRSKSESNGDLQACPKILGDSSLYPNDIHHGLWSDSSSSTQLNSSDSSTCETSQKFVKSLKDASFDHSKPNGVSESLTAPQNVAGKHEEVSEISWLRTKPVLNDSRMDLEFSQGFSPETKKTLQNIPSSLHVKELNTEKALGLPSSGKHQSNHGTRKNEKNEVSDLVMGFQNHVNLNPLPVSEIITGVSQLPSCKTDGQQNTRSSHESVDSLAAENLVAMSLDVFFPSSPASSDALHWFANVVSSKTARTEASDHKDGELDLFEAMTLKLEEVKPDEYCSQPQHQENHKNDGDRGTTCLLLSRPRRGQARRRRQRKDFQKDILPGLVSLSRHEVTEDIQSFEGMMRATGMNWQTGLAKRSAGRRARGRRQSRSSNPPSTSTPPATCFSKLEIGDRSVVGGWGRTRRGRRPRAKSGNASNLVL